MQTLCKDHFRGTFLLAEVVVVFVMLYYDVHVNPFLTAAGPQIQPILQVYFRPSRPCYHYSQTPQAWKLRVGMPTALACGLVWVLLE